jgi:hypothetical protein
MKTAIQLLCLPLALSAVTASASAQTAYPYNRSIQSVEVRPAEGQQAGTYEIIVGVQVNIGNPFPGGGQFADLSGDLKLYVDGQLRNTTHFDALATINGGGACEPCEDANPCGTMNGFNAFCVAPPQLPIQDCYCTSDVFLPLDEFQFVNPGSDITVAFETNANQLPEIFLPDDSFSTSFLGANYCVAAVNSTGYPAVISATGSPSVQLNDLTLEASPLPPNQFGVFYYGSSAIQVPFGDGFRCVGGQTTRLSVVNSGDEGVLRTTLDLTSQQAGGISAGATTMFQAWYRDPQGGGQGFNLSDGYMIAFIP